MERRTFVAAALLSFPIGLAGCLGLGDGDDENPSGTDSDGDDDSASGTDSPEATVEAWYESMQAGDVDERLSLMYSEYREWVEEMGDVEAVLDPFGGMEDGWGVEVEWDIDVESIRLVEKDPEPIQIVDQFPDIGHADTVDEREFVIHAVDDIVEHDTALLEVELSQRVDIEGESPQEFDQEVRMLLVEEDGKWVVGSFNRAG